MIFHVMTLFPEMIENACNTSILKRGMTKDAISLKTYQIRDYSKDIHGKVDDYPFGGGAGMLMSPQPVYDCYKAVEENLHSKAPVIYLSPKGHKFTQSDAERYAKCKELVFLCGHYEGIDERVLDKIVTDTVSIGDYVLTGGELPTLVMIDAISRLVDGVLHNEISAETETFDRDLLEYRQYTRPRVWEGEEVPEVLLSGNHKKIEAYRLEESKELTQKYRPDMYEKYQKREAVIASLKKDYGSLARAMMDSLYTGAGNVLEMPQGDLTDGDAGAIVSALDKGADSALVAKAGAAVYEDRTRTLMVIGDVSKLSGEMIDGEISRVLIFGEAAFEALNPQIFAEKKLAKGLSFACYTQGVALTRAKLDKELTKKTLESNGKNGQPGEDNNAENVQNILELLNTDKILGQWLEEIFEKTNTYMDRGRAYYVYLNSEDTVKLQLLKLLGFNILENKVYEIKYLQT